MWAISANFVYKLGGPHEVREPWVGAPGRAGGEVVCPKEVSAHCRRRIQLIYARRCGQSLPILQAWWPSPSPSSPPPQGHTTLNKTQGKHAGATGNRQQRHQPTAKLQTFKTNLRARRVYTRRGPQTQQQTAHTCSKRGFGQICSALQYTLVGHLRLMVHWK